MTQGEAKRSEESVKNKDINASQTGTTTESDQNEIIQNTPQKPTFSRPMIRINDLAQKEQLKKKSSRNRRTIIDPFGIADLMIDPPEVLPGETVTISFKATNNSDVYSMYTINLKINGEVVAAEVMKLPPGVAVPLYFTATRSLPGDYTVKVNHLIDKFTVIGDRLESVNEDLPLTEENISKSEARFELGLSEMDAYLQQKQSQSEIPTQSTTDLQSGINRAASIIEFGLDKIGDVLVFPIEKLVNLSIRLFKVIRGRKAK